jgi:hypothetical protein
MSDTKTEEAQPLTCYVVVGGNTSNLIAFERESRAESVRMLYDTRFPHASPHRVVKMMEVTEDA